MSTANSRNPQSASRLTVQQYLTFERAAADRHVFLDGVVIPVDSELDAMAGQKLPHGIISLNIGTQLNIQLKGTPCFAVINDTKVRSGLGVVPSHSLSGMFSYPGVLVICGDPEFFDDQNDIIMNPKVIIEVLSKSTEAFDRGEKFQRYRTWNRTLSDYLLVSQIKPHVEHFQRKSDDGWQMTEAIGLESTIAIDSIHCALRLVDVYDRVRFPETSEIS